MCLSSLEGNKKDVLIVDEVLISSVDFKCVSTDTEVGTFGDFSEDIWPNKIVLVNVEFYMSWY